MRRFLVWRKWISSKWVLAARKIQFNMLIWAGILMAVGLGFVWLIDGPIENVTGQRNVILPAGCITGFVVIGIVLFIIGSVIETYDQRKLQQALRSKK